MLAARHPQKFHVAASHGGKNFPSKYECVRGAISIEGPRGASEKWGRSPKMGSPTTSTRNRSRTMHCTNIVGADNLFCVRGKM